MYEGRTRGKKLKYTYDDDEDIFSDDQPARRSARNSSGVTAAEPSRPRFTASGRQVRSRAGGAYGESLLSGQREESDYEEEDAARPQRNRTSTHPNGYSGYGLDDLEDESDARSSDSGNEWDGGDEDENDFEGDDDGDDASGDESVINGEPRSLVVQLRYSKGKAPNGPQDPDEPPPAQGATMEDAGQVAVPQQPSAPIDTPQPTSAPEPAAAPSMAAPTVPSVPAPQMPSQPAAPKVNGLPMSALLNAPEPTAQVSANASHVPQAPIHPVSAPSEVPKTSHPVALNGWTGSHQGADNRPSSELPRAQAPPTS